MVISKWQIASRERCGCLSDNNTIYLETTVKGDSQKRGANPGVSAVWESHGRDCGDEESDLHELRMEGSVL